MAFNTTSNSNLAKKQKHSDILGKSTEIPVENDTPNSTYLRLNASQSADTEECSDQERQEQWIRDGAADLHASGVSQKPQFWRVLGIKEEEADHAHQWLLRLSARYFSLASVGRRSLCATVTAFDKPDPGRTEWLVEGEFIGITPLSSPDDAEVDIVAVTGLGGHALGSFRSENGSFVWLRDALPKALPRARILTYGYKTALAKNQSKESICDLAKVFLDAIASFRRKTKTQRRPICFVGHSLGGVVLKEALAISDNDQESDTNEVLLSTYGLILLGVPNLGLRHPQLNAMVEEQPNQRFVEDILVDKDEEPSAYLRELTNKFGRLCSKISPPFHIVSYYETERSPTVKLVEGGQFEMSGAPMMMVTKESAERVGHTIRNIEHLPMPHTNHRGLVRFDSAYDPRYVWLEDKIHMMTEKAPKTVQTRFRPNEDLSAEQQRLWTDLNRPPYSDFRESEKLVQPEDGTLQWLLEAELSTNTPIKADIGTTESFRPVENQATKPLTGSDFVDWRDCPESRCLLVTAPPGSGKSVLSNFVVTHLQNHTINRSREKIIYYFCNIRVPGSERNAEAVVRALIVQLCQNQKSLVTLLPPRFEKDSNAFREAPLSELWSLLDLMMQKNPYSHVYCVIDGLDVYGDCMFELVRKLLCLFGTSNARSFSPRKLLCTSRPERDIMEAWEGRLERQLRPNESDLRTFIEHRTASLKFSPSMREAARSAFVQDVTDPGRYYLARATFLWISVAIRKLEQMRHPTLAKVRAEIKTSPHDLDELFENLIKAACERAKENAVILAWVIYAEQPLTLEQLQEAAAIDPSCEYASYNQLEDSRPMLTEQSIRQELGVLLDVIEEKIFVIHQSVQDYVRRTKVLEKWISPKPRLYVGDCCMRYLLLCHTTNRASVEGHEEGHCEERRYPLQQISESWFRYIKAISEARNRLPMIRAILGLHPYMSSESTGTSSWDGEIIRPAYPFKTMCDHDICWMAELVLEGELLSPRQLLEDRVVIQAARDSKDLFKILIPHWQPANRQAMQLVTEAAARNSASGKEAMQLLLEEKGDEVQITPEVVEAAAGNNQVMELLLKRRGDEVRITPEVVKAAAGNYLSGKEVMQLLLKERGDEVQITPEVIKAAAGNHRGGKEVMQLLLKERGDEVQITLEVVKAAARSYWNSKEVMQLLLKERGDEVQITPEVIKAAVENRRSEEVMQLLLEERGDEVQITPEVVKAAARNIWSGKEVMELLLRERGDEVQITPEVIGAAAGNYWKSKEVVQLLIKERGDEVQITPEVIEAVAGNNWSGKEAVQLLLSKGKLDLRLRDRYNRTLISWAAIKGNRRMLVLLLRSSAESSAEAALCPRDKLGCSMVHFVSMGDCVEVMEESMSIALDIDAVDSQGWTALHWAAYFGHERAARTLIKHGADLSRRDQQGWTPYHLSVFSGAQRVEAMLRHGGNRSDGIIKEAGTEIGGLCDSCCRTLIGYQYHCKTCPYPPGYDLCFRCFRDVDYFHSEHDFDDRFRYK